MISNWQRYVREGPAGNTAVALLLFAASVPSGLATTRSAPAPTEWWPVVVCQATACVALLWHRSRPRTAVAVATASAMTVTALGYPPTVLILAPLMTALYALAVRADRATTRAYALVTVVLLVGTALIAGPDGQPLGLDTIGPAAWLLLAAAFGTSVQLRRAYLAAVQARAEHAERTREEEARHRVAEERMRIARELHDVVAHHLALANAQAGTAAHLVRNRPDQAQQILTDLIGTTSSALRELKGTVGLLRQAGDPDAPLEPTPGLARLPELTDALATAGLKVTVTTEGEPRPLSPGVDLTAYRIVQEALTNVTKHTATRAAEVRLSYSYDLLTIAVTDDGGAGTPATAAPGSGYGLIGMRERALSVGGHMSAGRRPDGGFEVTTELPLHPQNPEDDRTT
jgi:signal transduction histidine kinase